MKVLIVDDEVLVRKGIFLAVDWNKLGFTTVKEASNGVEALVIAKEIHPELVLTDIRMPKMDGLELINQLKIHCPKSIVIVLSCLNESKYVREAMQFGGAIDYIMKLSLSTEELIATIENAKNYIVSQAEDVDEQIPNYYINLTTKEESTLKDALDYSDLNLALSITKDIFQRINSELDDQETKVEWHEILAVYSSTFKKFDANLYDLKVQDEDLTIWVNASKDLVELEERILHLTTALFANLKMLKNKQYGVDLSIAIEYIHAHYNERISLSDVASAAGFNSSYFSKKFKIDMGMNFIDYLNKLRIEKAKELLQHSKQAIYEISDEVGFSDVSYFNRVFKKALGITPKQYIEQFE